MEPFKILQMHFKIKVLSKIYGWDKILIPITKIHYQIIQQHLGKLLIDLHKITPFHNKNSIQIICHLASITHP